VAEEEIQISVVGLGSIGTSIALALRQSDEPLFIVGHDKDPGNAGMAKKLKAVDKTDWNLIGACEKADIVFLAIPMPAIEETLRALAPHLKEGCVVTDTANLKGQVVEWAEALLPQSVNFVGGNPVVVSNGAGPDAADANLFRGKLYCITPASNVHPDAVSLVSGVVTLLGGTPYYLDPVEHDGLMAGAEHLPQAMALALASATMEDSIWREMRKLAGGSFERVIALLGDDPDALSAVLLANQDNLMRWLDSYSVAVKEIRDLVAQGEHESLAQAVDKAVVTRREWMRDRGEGFAEIKPVEVERTGFFRQMFLGGRRRRS
jgi:prephenate dehydrogenase